jgi:hypothetical protein
MAFAVLGGGRLISSVDQARQRRQANQAKAGDPWIPSISKTGKKLVRISLPGYFSIANEE